ncbi:MAG: energy transducer TonB [Gammaproteobacteria bacterium]|nr:energy transducer TonB [Gammaproteobacteria bacterium]
MKYHIFFAGLLLAGLAMPAVAEEEEDTTELEGYKVGQSRPNIDTDDMKIEIERPTFNSGFKLEKPKPSMSGIRMERPKLQVMQAPAKPASSGAAESGGETRSIQPVRMEAPEYPRSALRRGEEGYVVIEFTVQTDGSTTDLEVIESEPRNTFDREAMRAVSRWRFEPALRDGRPVQTRLQHTIEFNLNDDQGSLIPAQRETYALVGRDVKPVAMPQPDYPRYAVRRKLEGEVLVAFSVTPEGRPANIEVLDADPRGAFEEEVLRTVEQWRFEPVEGGVPQVRHVIEFSLSSP